MLAAHHQWPAESDTILVIMRRVRAFLDTNTFLHFPRLDHLDWPELLQATDVQLIIAPVVIRELNRHKDFPTSVKTRERAATALTMLDKWSDSSSPVLIRKFVELQFRVYDPLIDFPAFNLSRSISDDHLIATILEQRDESGQDPILLVTADLGLKLKAKTHQISIFQLPTNLRLPDDVLPEERKLRELETELKRMRDRLPRVRLLFANKEQHLKVQLPSSNGPTVEALSGAELRVQYPKMQIPKIESQPRPAQFLVGLAGVSPEDIETYNGQLDGFYAEYEKYVLGLRDFYAVRGRTTSGSILAVNDGTCPAQDVRIFMHFPDGFNLVTKENLPKEPAKPKPPHQPLTLAEKMAWAVQVPNFSLRPPHFDLPPNTGRANVSSPSIRRTKSYDVEVSIAALRHGFAEALEPLYLIFESRESARSFTIDYRIHAANLPDPSVGQLHFIIDGSTK